ncbi:hypothetical protein PO909_008124 [Leuciscus waleckii]
MRLLEAWWPSWSSPCCVFSSFWDDTLQDTKAPTSHTKPRGQMTRRTPTRPSSTPKGATTTRTRRRNTISESRGLCCS